MPALSIMVKPSSGYCNLNCKYCFYHDIVCSREYGQLGFMSRKTCDNLVDKAIDFAGGGKIYFVFQGGEPLLSGIEFFRYFVAKVKSRNYEKNVFYSLQTNATLINDDWAKFFYDNNFLVGVSLDGDASANKYRVLKDGTPSFENILQGIDILQKHNVQFNILSVVTGYFAENAVNIYKFFKEKGYKFLQFIPCLKPIGDHKQNELYMTEKQYGKYLNSLFKVYAEDFLNGNYISIRSFDNMVRLLGGVRAEQCGAEGFCSRQFVVEGNGNVYPCDFYCSDEWLLGNINECDFTQLFQNEKGREFITQSFNNVLPKCKKCSCYVICRGGGCKREKDSMNYCSAKQNFFNKNKHLFEQILCKLQVKS